jgi:hypothetical protein
VRIVVVRRRRWDETRLRLVERRSLLPREGSGGLAADDRGLRAGFVGLTPNLRVFG